MKEKFWESKTGKKLNKYCCEFKDDNKKRFGVRLTEECLESFTFFDILTEIIPDHIRADKAIDTEHTEDLNEQPLIKNYEIFFPFSMEDLENHYVHMIVQYDTDTPKE